MRISRIAATITISLKVDEIMECSWLTALWPCWVALCLLLVVSVGVLLLLIGTVYWWIGKKCSWDEVLCTMWLCWGVVGWSGSFGLALLLAALANDSKLSTYWLKTSIIFPFFFLHLVEPIFRSGRPDSRVASLTRFPISPFSPSFPAIYHPYHLRSQDISQSIKYFLQACPISPLFQASKRH